MGANLGQCCTKRDDRDELDCLAPYQPGKPDREGEPGARSTTSVSTDHAKSQSRRLTRISTNSKAVTAFWDMEALLGEGSYGVVVKGVNKDTKAVRAIKSIDKSKLVAQGKKKSRNRKDGQQADGKVEAFKREVGIMSVLVHPHIIRLYETFEDDTHYHLVMEICRGGELFDFILAAGRFSEVGAAHTMDQILKGINYMHKSNVAHRDLKPENFLLVSKDSIEQNTIKIIDFGLSCHFHGKELTTKAGTALYVAPEVLKGSYNELCDEWSCGVIMYILLCGSPPFNGSGDVVILDKIRKKQYNFNGKAWKTVSEDAKDLINIFLVTNHRRCTAERALDHPWIAQRAPKATGAISGLVDSLKSFQAANKFKKVALRIIVDQMDDANAELRDIFKMLDKNGDGLLSAEEIRTGMEQAGVQDLPADLPELINAIDADGSGVIDYTEFLSAAISEREWQNDDIMYSAFRAFDKDGDGKISIEELRSALEQDADDDLQRHPSELLAAFDTSGDGEIDFDEFKAMMMAKTDTDRP